MPAPPEPLQGASEAVLRGIGCGRRRHRGSAGRWGGGPRRGEPVADRYYTEPKEDVLEEKIRQMLRDLGRALSDAMAESSDVNRALRRIHEEGYSLFIFLERKEGDEAGEAVDPAREPAGVERRGEPVFRIHGGDLSFLRSIGIDPTRKVRGKRQG